MVRLLTLWIGSTIFVSALVTPAVFLGLRSIWDTFPWPYSRVFDRVILLFAIAFFPFVWRSPHFASLRGGWKAMLSPSEGGYLRIVETAFVSLASALLFFPIQIWSGQMVWQTDGYIGWNRGLGMISTGAVVGTLEELLFRGVLFQSLRKVTTTIAAAMISSLLYAVVHFVTPDKAFDFTIYDPLIGFTYLVEISSRLGHPGTFEGMVGLFIVGLILCFTLVRSGSLLPGIGLHAGWIMAAKLATFTLAVAPHIEVPLGLGKRYFLVASPMTWFSFLLVLGYIAIRFSKRKVRE